MAHLCIVAPVNILQGLEEHGVMGPHHLLLAHDVVKRPDEYQRLFGNRYRSHKDLIILDNSAYELKSSVDFKMVLDACAIVHPTCVVLPDHYLDGASTAFSTLAAIDTWTAALTPFNVELMAIPQGQDYKEWIWCAEQLAEHQQIKWWGVPRNLQEVHGISRRDGAQILHSLDPHRRFHMFGFSHNYVDDLLATRLPFVESIDSTTPLRVGSLGAKWSLSDKPIPRGDWWDTAEWNNQILDNLSYARGLFRKG